MRISSTSLAALLAPVALGLALAACGDDGGDSPIDGGNDIDAPAGALSCQTYCAQAQTNCLDGAQNRQYVDMDTCLASCAFMPVGSVADTQGNTLGCRTYHSGTPAMTNPMLHCPHAGPGGAGACGSNCEGFCQIVMGACTGANAAYASMGECMTTCSTFADTTRYNTQVMTGPSLACKLYHATVATTNPALHCPHVKATGGPCSAPPAAQ